MKTTLRKDLNKAILRSESHDEIVHVDVENDSGDVLECLRDLFAEGEIDYVITDCEGQDRMDVWGWNDKTPENEQDWRLAIYFVGECADDDDDE